MTLKEYLKKFIIYGIPAGFVLLIAAYTLACWSIGTGVKSISEEALAIYSGDTVDALMKYMDAEEHSLQKRNRAVWALGQLGQTKALAVLEKNFTGDPCDHSKYLCQYELKKAIKACRGESWNIVRWTWIRSIPLSRDF